MQMDFMDLILHADWHHLLKKKKKKCLFVGLGKFILTLDRQLKPHCDKILVVLGFKTTLTAMVISWWLVALMCLMAFSHQY